MAFRLASSWIITCLHRSLEYAFELKVLRNLLLAPFLFWLTNSLALTVKTMWFHSENPISCIQIFENSFRPFYNICCDDHILAVIHKCRLIRVPTQFSVLLWERLLNCNVPRFTFDVQIHQYWDGRGWAKVNSKSTSLFTPYVNVWSPRVGEWSCNPYSMFTSVQVKNTMYLAGCRLNEQIKVKLRRHEQILWRNSFVSEKEMPD